MEGQVRGFDEPFTTGAGEEVMAPTVHPRCNCGVDIRPKRGEEDV